MPVATYTGAVLDFQVTYPAIRVQIQISWPTEHQTLTNSSVWFKLKEVGGWEVKRWKEKKIPSYIIRVEGRYINSSKLSRLKKNLADHLNSWYLYNVKKLLL